jgi:hypothetical protein
LQKCDANATRVRNNQSACARRISIILAAGLNREINEGRRGLIRHIHSHYGKASRRRMAALRERLKAVIAETQSVKAWEAAQSCPTS